MSRSPSRDEEIALRGHHIFCLLGFRGYGYSKAFVENMSRIAARLNSDPHSTRVRVLQEPDDLCTACPFLGGEGCQDEGPGSEARVRKRDAQVMGRLNLSPRDVLGWAELLSRVKKSVSVSALPSLCADCRWLPQGYCQEGVRRLLEGGSG